MKTPCMHSYRFKKKKLLEITLFLSVRNLWPSKSCSTLASDLLNANFTVPGTQSRLPGIQENYWVETMQTKPFPKEAALARRPIWLSYPHCSWILHQVATASCGLRFPLPLEACVSPPPTEQQDIRQDYSSEASFSSHLGDNNLPLPHKRRREQQQCTPGNCTRSRKPTSLDF